MSAPFHQEEPPRMSQKIISTGRNPRDPGTGTPEAYIADIETAEGWQLLINILCEELKVPGESQILTDLYGTDLTALAASIDLTTRSGLKKVHGNFQSIYGRLDRAYKRYSQNDRISGKIFPKSRSMISLKA